MSQLIVNFIGKVDVSTSMYFRVRTKVVGSPNAGTHDSEFLAAMEALAASQYFNDVELDYENAIERGQLLSFAEEVDPQDVMFFIIDTVAAQGWYFHGEGLGLLVFHQAEDADEKQISQVVVQPRDDDNRTLNVVLVDVNLDTQGNHEERFALVMSDFSSQQTGASSFVRVSSSPGRSYQYRPVIRRVFSPGDMVRMITLLGTYGWIYHGDAEDNYVFYRET